MGLRDILKKKSTLEASDPDPATVSRLAGPEFTFVRSDTYTHEVIHPPQYPDGDDGDDDAGGGTYLTARDKEKDKTSSHRLSLDVFRGSRSRSASASSHGTAGGNKESSSSAGGAARRLSHRLHLARSPTSSEMVPQDLPAIVTHRAPDGREDRDGTESQWEKRATMLARENEKHRSRPPTPVGGGGVEDQLGRMRLGSPGEQGRRGGGEVAVPVVVAGPDDGVVSSKAIDEDIQEAIRLHEEGDLQRSTALFARLADPKGANNPLSQVLYGLALRHGWGCAPDPGAAVNYLSAAASNAATVENLALQAGLKKGGAAKGELVLAIFELANCFRHGWGIPKDAVAAKQYYETAANLGDTDAMNEVAWCYLEGYGTKKDKYAAARYYRLAEQNGNKTLGNSWIWKDKYSPENAKK